MRDSQRLRLGAMLPRRYFSITIAAQGAAAVAPKPAFSRYTATAISRVVGRGEADEGGVVVAFVVLHGAGFAGYGDAHIGQAGGFGGAAALHHGHHAGDEGGQVGAIDQGVVLFGEAGQRAAVAHAAHQVRRDVPAPVGNDGRILAICRPVRLISPCPMLSE